MNEAEIKDEILKFIRDSNKVELASAIAAKLEIDKDKVDRLIRDIAEDKFIVCTYSTDLACKISQKGKDFLATNSYKHQENLHLLRNQKGETKQELEIQQLRSVIATNEATKDIYEVQKKQGTITIIIISVTAILSLLTLVKEIWLSPPIIDKETKQLLQKQTISIDSLGQNLRRIDSTFRIVADSLKN